MATVENNGHYYEVRDTENGNDWSFDLDDADLDYIADAIEAWKAWREYVVKNGLTADD